MAANLLSWVSCIAVPILVGLVGCSRSQDDSSAHAPDSAVTPAINHVDLFRQYDPASLVEVTKFSGLPEGLRTMIRVGNVTEDHVLSDDDPGGGRIFVAGGASTTSALVGYQVGDYLPVIRGTAYVYSGGEWKVAKVWQKDVGYPRTFGDLLFITKYLSKHSSDDRNDGTP
jgi:hypothetical protein